jgi:hypothetical protein
MAGSALLRLTNSKGQTMNENVVEAGSPIISFSLDPEITAALDKAASADLSSRSAYIRKLVIRHLQSTGSVRDYAHIGKGPRRRTHR